MTLLAAVLLLSLFSGCGTKDASDTKASAAGGESAVVPVQSTLSAAEPEEGSALDKMESAEDNEGMPEEDDSLTEAGIYSYHYTEIPLPLTEENVTMTLWTDFLPPLFAAMSGMEENSVYMELEKRTNIHLDITSVAITEASTNASLVVASGEFPDFWFSFVNYYGGTIDSAVEDEIILNLADYKEYMPNYPPMPVPYETWTVEGSLSPEGHPRAMEGYYKFMKEGTQV